MKIPNKKIISKRSLNFTIYFVLYAHKRFFTMSFVTAPISDIFPWCNSCSDGTVCYLSSVKERSRFLGTRNTISTQQVTRHYNLTRLSFKSKCRPYKIAKQQYLHIYTDIFSTSPFSNSSTHRYPPAEMKSHAGC